MTDDSLPQYPLDLDSLYRLAEKYNLENGLFISHPEQSRLCIVRSLDDDGRHLLDIGNVTHESAEELILLLESLPRLIQFARRIKQLANSGPINVSGIEP
jgi:hypothetical protein